MGGTSRGRHSAIVEEGSATATGYGNGNPAYADPNGIISVGPNRYTDPYGSWHWMKGTNLWDTHTGAGETYWRQTLNVNRGTITKYANWLNARETIGKLHYSVEISSCVSHTSRALNLSGIFNIGIHPYLLNAQTIFIISYLGEIIKLYALAVYGFVFYFIIFYVF